MEIEVSLRISNRSLYFKTHKSKKVDFMINEGWNMVNKRRTLFSTTFSFTKII